MASTTKTKPKRGRPRPQEVIDRDEEVYEAIEDGGSTCEEIADVLGIEPNLVYLSLYRLRRDEWVDRARSTYNGKLTRRWVRT